ncbi:MAG TPA: alpha/beta hydrolase [Gaiellaceae bacterium]|nr:alpha/beta hydrolase [Gaiellaceae bacterium]
MGRLTTGDGRTLAYERRGSGPALVCHPGGPGLPGAELADLGGLDDALELVILDPRGTGTSTRPADAAAYDFEHYVADLEELRVHLGQERIDLLGFSHGGMVAMAYAAAHPKRIGRLLLVGTLAHRDESLDGELERGLAERQDEPWFADARAALAEEEAGHFEDEQALAENLSRQWPLYFGRYGEREQAFVQTLAGLVPNADALRRFNSAVWPSLDLRPALARVEAPTLVVAGERDFVAPPAAARAIAEAIPEAELVVVPGAGHFVFVEAPDAFRRAVASFLGVGAPA